MLNIYRIIKDYIPIGSRLYLSARDKYITLTKLNNENDPNAIECEENNVVYYFDKNNKCTNYIYLNYDLNLSKEPSSFLDIINIYIGEPVMFKTPAYGKLWLLGRYINEDNILAHNVYFNDIIELIPIKYFDFENF